LRPSTLSALEEQTTLMREFALTCSQLLWAIVNKLDLLFINIHNFRLQQVNRCLLYVVKTRESIVRNNVTIESLIECLKCTLTLAQTQEMLPHWHLILLQTTILAGNSTSKSLKFSVPILEREFKKMRIILC